MQEVTIKQSSSPLQSVEIKTFLNPKFIFIPVLDGYKMKVTDNTVVYKGDIVLMNAKGHSLRSTVSGKVLGLKKMDYLNKKAVPSIVIENDFKENLKSKKSARKYINEYSKKDFMRVLEDFSREHKGVYLEEKFANPREVVIINGVELESLFANKQTILKNMEDILETSDFLGEMLEAKKIFFTLKNTDTDAINRMSNLVGTYPSINLRLITDEYPNGHGEIQKKLLKVPEAAVLDVEEVYNIYKMLKREGPITQKFITISGDAVTPNGVIEVKIGSLISEVFVNNFDFSEREVDVYINGSLYGQKVDNLKYVIDSFVDGVFVTKKDSLKEGPCINCGQCSKNCPVGLNPKFVFDKNRNVKPEYYDKCIQCGLCNYVCPANRDLKSMMKGSET